MSTITDASTATGKFYLFEATGTSTDGTLAGEEARWHKTVQADQTEDGWDAPTTFNLQ